MSNPEPEQPKRQLLQHQSELDRQWQRLNEQLQQLAWRQQVLAEREQQLLELQQRLQVGDLGEDESTSLQKLESDRLREQLQQARQQIAELQRQLELSRSRTAAATATLEHVERLADELAAESDDHRDLQSYTQPEHLHRWQRQLQQRHEQLQQLSNELEIRSKTLQHQSEQLAAERRHLAELCRKEDSRIPTQPASAPPRWRSAWRWTLAVVGLTATVVLVSVIAIYSFIAPTGYALAVLRVEPAAAGESVGSQVLQHWANQLKNERLLRLAWQAAGETAGGQSVWPDFESFAVDARRSSRIRCDAVTGGITIITGCRGPARARRIANALAEGLVRLAEEQRRASPQLKQYEDLTAQLQALSLRRDGYRLMLQRLEGLSRRLTGRYVFLEIVPTVRQRLEKLTERINRLSKQRSEHLADAMVKSQVELEKISATVRNISSTALRIKNATNVEARQMLSRLLSRQLVRLESYQTRYHELLALTDPSQCPELAELEERLHACRQEFLRLLQGRGTTQDRRRDAEVRASVPSVQADPATPWRDTISTAGAELQKLQRQEQFLLGRLGQLKAEVASLSRVSITAPARPESTMVRDDRLALSLLAALIAVVMGAGISRGLERRFAAEGYA